MELIGRTGVDKTCVGWRLNEVDNPMRNQRAKQPSGPAYTTVTYAPFRGRIYTCILFLQKHILIKGHLALGTRVHIHPTPWTDSLITSGRRQELLFKIHGHAELSRSLLYQIWNAGFNSGH